MQLCQYTPPSILLELIQGYGENELDSVCPVEDGFVDEAVDEFYYVAARILQPRYIHQVVVLIQPLELRQEGLRLALRVSDGEALSLILLLNHLALFLRAVRQLLGNRNLVEALGAENKGVEEGALAATGVSEGYYDVFAVDDL